MADKADKTDDDIVLAICEECQKKFDPEDSPLDCFCSRCTKKAMADEDDGEDDDYDEDDWEE